MVLLLRCLIQFLTHYLPFWIHIGSLFNHVALMILSCACLETALESTSKRPPGIAVRLMLRAFKQPFIEAHRHWLLNLNLREVEVLRIDQVVPFALYHR
jgi:hypothetical protein